MSEYCGVDWSQSSYSVTKLSLEGIQGGRKKGLPSLPALRIDFRFEIICNKLDREDCSCPTSYNGSQSITMNYGSVLDTWYLKTNSCQEALDMLQFYIDNPYVSGGMLDIDKYLDALKRCGATLEDTIDMSKVNVKVERDIMQQSHRVCTCDPWEPIDANWTSQMNSRLSTISPPKGGNALPSVNR